MGSKADDQALFRAFQRQRPRLLLTPPRQGADKSPTRQPRVKVLTQRENKNLSKQRSDTVEPLQGLLKGLVEWERCRRRGKAHTRWLCAARGVAGPMQQYRAGQEGRPLGASKAAVLGR
jgi:hypothetical protein